MIYEVNNIYDAYRLIVRFKTIGKYHWFRGQSRNWALNSSLARLNKIDRQNSINKLLRFISWIKNEKGTKSFSKDIDKIIAVAQHYGIPTNFIDFTTEPKVACYFCTRKKWARKNWVSSIICINTIEIQEKFQKYKQNEICPELLNIDLLDLWRLNSQKGRFLFLPYINFEKHLSIDRINFPFTSAFSLIEEQEVFPDRKSPLETIIDKFFDNEKVIAFHEYVKKDKKIKKFQMSSIDESYKVIKKQLSIHNTWKKNTVNKWSINTGVFIPKKFQYENIVLNINFIKNHNILFQKVYDEIFINLNNIANLKSKYLTWEINFSDKRKLNNKYLELYWDGTKLYPYKLEDIAYGLSNCIVLQFISKKNRFINDEKLKEFITDLWGESLYIEIASNSAHSRAFVCVENLKHCIRSDIQKYIKFNNLIEEDISELLLYCNKVKYLFNFDKMCKLFSREIIPTQIIRNNGMGSIIYSPANLNILGIP